MKKFRIKEVKNARVNSMGQKASLFYPQVSTFFGLFFRNIHPKEMKSDAYSGDVIKFANDANAYSFISEYRKVIGWKPATKKESKPQKERSVVYHPVNW